MWVAFALQKLLTFFSKKFQHICVSLDVNFNESLTNDVISFEQMDPDMFHWCFRENKSTFFHVNHLLGRRFNETSFFLSKKNKKQIF